MFAEGAYLLFYNNASYRKNINRRLKVMDDKPDRASVLVQLRRERGLPVAANTGCRSSISISFCCSLA